MLSKELRHFVTIFVGGGSREVLTRGLCRNDLKSLFAATFYFVVNVLLTTLSVDHYLLSLSRNNFSFEGNGHYKNY